MSRNAKYHNGDIRVRAVKEIMNLDERWGAQEDLHEKVLKRCRELEREWSGDSDTKNDDEMLLELSLVFRHIRKYRPEKKIVKSPRNFKQKWLLLKDYDPANFEIQDLEKRRWFYKK